MGSKKGNFEKFKNSMVINELIALVVMFFQVHLRNSQKRMNEKEPTR